MRQVIIIELVDELLNVLHILASLALISTLSDTFGYLLYELLGNDLRSTHIRGANAIGLIVQALVEIKRPICVFESLH